MTGPPTVPGQDSNPGPLQKDERNWDSKDYAEILNDHYSNQSSHKTKKITLYIEMSKYTDNLIIQTKGVKIYITKKT